MSDQKRPRFQINTEVRVSTEYENDQFAADLNNMLRGKKRPDSPVQEETAVVQTDMQIASLLTTVASSEPENANSIDEFVPANPDDTFFPFSKDFKFQVSNGTVPTILDYLVNVSTPYKAAENQQESFKNESGEFYINVPWVQLHNTNPIVSFKDKEVQRTYDKKNNPLYFKLVNNSSLKGEFDIDKFTKNEKFTDRVLRIRRPIVSSDILSLLIITLGTLEKPQIQEILKKYFDVIKGVYGKNLPLRGDELIFASGGTVSFFSVYKPASVNIEAAINKYTEDDEILDKEATFLRYLILSALYINDNDTRVGFITDPEYGSQLDQRLAQLDAYIKLFKSFAGLTEGRETMFYQDFMEGFDKFLESYKGITETRAGKDSKSYFAEVAKAIKDSSITLKALSTATTSISNYFAGAASKLEPIDPARAKKLSDELEELRKEISVLIQLTKDLTLMTSPYNMEVARLGTEIRGLIMELRKIYVTQKAEIKMWKDMYEDLKKNKGIQGGNNKSKVGLSKASELTANARNYLTLLIKQFLLTNPLMKLIYNVSGTAQLKDISTYLNLNLAAFLLEELCENIPDIKESWQDLASVDMRSFGVVKQSTRTIMMYFELHKDKAFQMMASAEYFLAPPVYKAFMDTYQYVDLLFRKGRCPMTFSQLISEDFKGVSLEMAAMIAALMTKEQDLQKQHATTRFDKPGINMAVVQARLAVRKKMEIHLDCSFEGLERVELII